MRAIGYFNVKGQEHVISENMELAFAKYCQQNMHEPVATFISNNDGEPNQSPEYLQMLDYIRQSGNEYLLVVPSAIHLGKDLESVAREVVGFDKMGASVVCSDESVPDVFQNAFHTLGVKGISLTRGRRIKESMRARALQGQALGRPPYGYRVGDNGMLEAVRGEVSVVELIFRLYTRDGMGLRLIAQHLNDREIKTRRGGRWNVTSLRDILKNPVYTGTYTRLGMRRPKVHPAIIPADVFRSAQDLTSSRRPIGRVIHSEPYLLSGVIYCSYCGNKMMGVTRRQSWKRMDGHRTEKVYRYYQCQSRNNQSLCGYHTWRESLLEATVLGQLRYALRAMQTEMPTVVKNNTPEKLKEYATQVKNAERGLIRAMRRMSEGETNIRMIGEYLKELDAARRTTDGDRSPMDVEAIFSSWESLNMAEKKSFIAENVARVNVEDDSVEVEVQNRR